RDARGIPRSLSADRAPIAATNDVAPRGRRDDVRGVRAGVSEEAPFRFAGKVAVVTGAARGVGREIVRAFVEAGAQVVAADRDGDGLTETCRPHGARASAVVADISTTDGATAIVARATEVFGRVDICVNNAAVAPHAALLDERVEVWDRVYAVNCRGTFLMTQAAARVMIAGGRGGRI